MQVPVESPLWDIDPSLGDRVWGVSDIRNPTRAPSKEYSSPILLSIEPWLYANVSHNLGCIFCPAIGMAGTWVGKIQRTQISRATMPNATLAWTCIQQTLRSAPLRLRLGNMLRSN